MSDLLLLWTQRAAEHEHALRACEAALEVAGKEDRLGLRIRRDRQRLLAEFWGHAADLLSTRPDLLHEAAVRECALHRVLADSWEVVRLELAERPADARAYPIPSEPMEAE